MEERWTAWSEQEAEAFRAATANAVDGLHVPILCEHCGRVKQLRDYWMGHPREFTRLLYRRRNAGRLLMQEGVGPN